MNDAFTLAPHVQLVDVNTARAIIGRSADAILAMVDSGGLRWAFDISAGSRKLRCIRIFRGCLQAWTRKTEHRAELGEVLDAILTTNRPRLRASELVERWSCGHDLLNHLVRGRQLTGAITGHALWISRQSAARFLEARLIGHAFQKDGLAGSFIGRRSPDPGQAPSPARRGQEPICMFLQGAYPPARPEITRPRLKR